MTQLCSRPSIRVVIVNWRQPELTARACSSIESQLKSTDRLIVVDNASGDSSVELLRDAGIDVIEAPTNGGFGSGVNIGAQGMTEDILVLLNNDAVACPGFLDALVAPLTWQSCTVAATTALILLTGRWRHASPDDSTFIIDAAGTRWSRLPDEDDPTVGTVLVNSTGNVVDRSGNGSDRDWLTPLENLSADTEVFGICGGACAVRADVWDQLGGFREDLFLYYEDTELSWRIHKLGYDVRFVPEAVAFHEHSASSEEGSDTFVRANVRNRILVTAAHDRPIVLLKALAKTTARAIKTRNPTIRNALCEALLRLPGEYRRRRGAPNTAPMSRSRS